MFFFVLKKVTPGDPGAFSGSLIPWLLRLVVSLRVHGFLKLPGSLAVLIHTGSSAP